MSKKKLKILKSYAKNWYLYNLNNSIGKVWKNWLVNFNPSPEARFRLYIVWEFWKFKLGFSPLPPSSSARGKCLRCVTAFAYFFSFFNIFQFFILNYQKKVEPEPNLNLKTLEPEPWIQTRLLWSSKRNTWTQNIWIRATNPAHLY